ncbi:MAG: hypothetical protein H6680_07245 [Desulfobacteraceae bacterium]|nr:hypothetical protein [Desulfobacteraceae bacterium]
MDYRIKWSPEAVEDVESIAEYIDKDSPDVFFFAFLISFYQKSLYIYKFTL